MFKLSKYLKPYWKECVLLVLATGVQSWFALMLPSEMAKIINYGIVENNQAFIYQTGLKMVIYSLISSACAVVAGFYSSRIGANFSRDVRKDIYQKVLSFSVADNDKFDTASLITRTTNDVTQVQQTVSMVLSIMLRAPMMAITAIFKALATSPNMTWIIALAVGIIVFSAVAIISIVIPKFKLFQKLFDKITMLTRENLTGIRVVRAFNNEKIEHKKFAKTNQDLTMTSIFTTKIISLINPLTMLVFNGICLLCIWIGLQNYEFDASYLGNMIAFMRYAIQISMSFMILTIVFMNLPRANVSAGRINEVLHSRSKISWKDHSNGKISDIPSVVFEDVDFKYANAEDNVLSDISFTAKMGETTAIIGSTGSGKSTIANLIPRFYDVSNGKILLNGLDVREYAQKDLMSAIGFVPQKGVLFSGSIKSNIKFANKNLSDDNMKLAAKISQSENFIDKKDKKYDAFISQSGTNVSGGQKQRLSIARAIAKNPKVYVFDDSFSALDMKTDANLRASLKPITKNAVTIIIAQRISTIKDAEQIIVLDKGKIVGKGDHKDLLKRCKIYQEIVKSQVSDSEYQQELALASEEVE